MAALERAGCEVVYRRQTLRELGLLRYAYALWMIASAHWVYRRAARVMMERTRAAFVARSRVNTILVNQHPQADAVILITANSGYASSIASRRPQLIVYTDYGNLLSKALPDRGFELEERKTYPLWNQLERQALLIQDRVFVMGQHVKPAMEAAYGIPPEKIAVVGAGPGLDVDIERDRGIKDPSNRTILFVGKLAAVKGLDVLLQAFAIVRDAYPDAILHVVTGNPVAAPGVVFHGKLCGARAQGAVLFVQHIHHAGVQRALGFGVFGGDVVKMRVHRYYHRFHAGVHPGRRHRISHRARRFRCVGKSPHGAAQRS